MADSADMWDIARSVIITGFTPETGIRYLSHEKSNYGELMDTILYTIEEERVELVGISDCKDVDYVRALREQKHHKAERLDNAKDKIMSTLSHGYRTIKDVDSICMAEGISRATLQRAKSELKKANVIKEWSEGVCDKHVWYMDTVKESINDIE